MRGLGLFVCPCPRCGASISAWALLSTRKIWTKLAWAETVPCPSCSARIRLAGSYWTQQKKVIILGFPSLVLLALLCASFPSAAPFLMLGWFLLLNPLFVYMLGLEIVP